MIVHFLGGYLHLFGHFSPSSLLTLSSALFRIWRSGLHSLGKDLIGKQVVVVLT
jgi:hypothetical protein